MKEYDAIVIGSGCGTNIVSEALEHDLEVALVDKGPIGGTCPNLGCIPSKMLIHAADRVVDAVDGKKLGVTARVESIDFNFIMERMRRFVKENQRQMRKSLSHAHGLDFYEGEGHFVDEYTMEVNGEKIKGKKIFIASGSRPIIPPIKGLDTIDYLTNATLLQLKTCPTQSDHHRRRVYRRGIRPLSSRPWAARSPCWRWRTGLSLPKNRRSRSYCRKSWSNGWRSTLKRWYRSSARAIPELRY